MTDYEQLDQEAADRLDVLDALEAVVAERDALKVELEKIKRQEPAGFVDSDMEWFDATGFCVMGGTKLYLAAGARGEE